MRQHTFTSRTVRVLLACLSLGLIQFIAGCSTSTAGDPSSALSMTDRQRYSDEKGHFHPEWVGETNR